MIKFGTSGWRGLIARDFTFDNVRLATQAIAEYLTHDHGEASTLDAPRPKNQSQIVIMGYDTRFLGREFSLAAAEVLAANGLTPLYLRFDGKRTGRLERQGACARERRHSRVLIDGGVSRD